MSRHTAMPLRGAALVLAALAVPPATAGPHAAEPARAAGRPQIAGSAPAAAPDETREVLEAVRAWNRAFARNDVETFFSFIDEGITTFGPSSPYRVEGIADDRAGFERDLDTGRGRVGFFREMQPLVQRYGDLAVVTYYSRGDYGEEKQDRTLYYKETDVLVKRGGRWTIVHIHVSATH